MAGEIVSIAALEACIGKTPSAMHMKVIDHLDAGARTWLSASTLMFAGFGSPGMISVTLCGGAPGFMEVTDPSRMRLSPALADSPELARAGQSFGSLFLIPTINETLRVNGRVAAVDGAAIEIAVEECYVHCGKALIRSDFWKANPQTEVAGAPSDYLDASRFIALATVDASGHADLSPKGDPAGMMIRANDDGAWFADRPGNRRADSFRNILTQPRVALAALVPGASHVALIAGEARLTSDENVRASFAVQYKSPLLATRIDRPQISLIASAALERSRPWPAKPPDIAVDPAAVIAGHVKLSGRRGLQAALVRTAVSVPGLMQQGLTHDYKTRLY